MSGAHVDPVVVMGMHRSGTSVIIRMLQRMGVFTGWELDANGEAIYFVLRNRAILEAQGARWDRPGPVDELLDNDALRRRLVETLRRDLSAPGVASYLGPVGYLRYRSLERFDSAWGWKDPRNTLLLGVWLEIFPSARVVHVVRNGVDVALSLARRERRRLDYVVSGEQAVSSLLRSLVHPPAGCGRLAWAFSQVRLRLRADSLRRRFGQLRVHPVIDPVQGFALWEQYVKRAEGNEAKVPGGLLRTRYEDVLRDPLGEAKRLAAFCGLEPGNEALEQAAAIVDATRPSRGDDTNVPGFLDHVRDSPWLRRLGYGEPTPGPR